MTTWHQASSTTCCESCSAVPFTMCTQDCREKIFDPAAGDQTVVTRPNQGFLASTSRPEGAPPGRAMPFDYASS